MSLRFSSSKTLRVEGVETLDEEAIVFSGESSIEEDEEQEGEDKSQVEGLRLRLGFTKLEEAEDMVNVKWLA